MFNDWKEVIEADTENKLKVSSHLLWDVKISGLTPAKWQAMRFFVVQRVIERGDESDFYAIFKLYGGFDGV
ncbi:MAG: hypothetical protein LBS03_03310, partial [Bacteroidales bacterium]|nr:hypothetical protein [Bacteroidales bacterium]